MLENYLCGDNNLSPEETQALYVAFKNRHPNLKPRTQEFKEALIQDELFNCLLLKFGYAVTCHKAQGGEWDHVFIAWDNDTAANFDFRTSFQRREGKNNEGFFRWAYTAVTRASVDLYTVNPPLISPYSNMALVLSQEEQSLMQLGGQALQPEEVVVDGELAGALERYGLFNEHLAIQDHFIQIWFALRKKYIDLIGWRKSGYEVWYLCAREGEKAGFQTYFNGQHRFNGTYRKLPAHTNSERLFEEGMEALKTAPKVVVQRNTSETILPKIEFDLELEEKLPFLAQLYQDLSTELSSHQIAVEALDHQNYHERYHFMRGMEKAVVDFVYDGKGFFGNAVPVHRFCTSTSLLNDISSIIENLRNHEYQSSQSAGNQLT